MAAPQQNSNANDITTVISALASRQAGRAKVLKPLHQAALHELEARLDQELAGKRVADLYARAHRGRALAEVGAREH